MPTPEDKEQHQIRKLFWLLAFMFVASCTSTPDLPLGVDDTAPIRVGVNTPVDGFYGPYTKDLFLPDGHLVPCILWGQQKFESAAIVAMSCDWQRRR